MFVVENVEVVMSPDVIVTSPCLELVFRPWHGCSRQAVTEEEPVGRPWDVGHSPKLHALSLPPLQLWAFEDEFSLLSPGN